MWRGTPHRGTPLLRLALAVLLAALTAGAAGWRPAHAAAGQPPNKLRYRTFLPLAATNPAALRGHGVLPPAGSVQTYVLREGDNLADLAVELGRDVSAMACVTPSGTYPLTLLRPGMTLVIPPPEYLCHTVQAGDTAASVAERYGVSPDVLLRLAWNELESLQERLEPGRRLLVPGGVRPALERPAETRPQPSPTPAATATPTPGPARPTPGPAPEPWPYGDGRFIWPVEGEISQGYHSRHRGLDIATAFGAPVVAADNGVVTRAGWSDAGYGLRIVIDHQIDYITLYAHLSEVYVEEGQVVEKGQVIGRVGSTGNSTGPHLHFELRDFGYLIDPLTRLEPR
ncbi:MAG: LysM peptidoglycan-binding domain-containing M23 family metallopeptidase [Caldilineales bacterium]|nr:LysM peptidoglycan-binding domain-containing M23 family metallopeptidase [Caldilineales bacterium]